MTFPVTGQPMPVAKQTYATHLVAPIVPQSFLTDSDHDINDASKSGKQKGASVICKLTSGKLVYAVARGHLPTDKWDITTSGTDVVPA